MQSHQPTGLTPEKVQLFVAGLSGLSADEVRKAKLLLIRNELSQLRAPKKSLAGIAVAQGCFAIVPLFWPRSPYAQASPSRPKLPEAVRRAILAMTQAGG